MLSKSQTMPTIFTIAHINSELGVKDNTYLIFVILFVSEL